MLLWLKSLSAAASGSTGISKSTGPPPSPPAGAAIDVDDAWARTASGNATEARAAAKTAIEAQVRLIGSTGKRDQPVARDTSATRGTDHAIVKAPDDIDMT
ncbi:hypothetical protein [Burkholderia sp. Bp8963]|uniref:hypothetical protein n=1 Tax=Burkholderia sp. Bp8963 TaxID=2184547 RepID=UPI000F599158|nr:hypothetical protein [Burkholderia sp. Bp8963]